MSQPPGWPNPNEPPGPNPPNPAPGNAGQPPTDGGYPQQGYPDPTAYQQQGGYPDPAGYPPPGGYQQGGYPQGGYQQGGGYPPPGENPQGGYPQQGGYPDQAAYPQPGYPQQPGYPDPAVYPQQGGYPDQAGYPQPGEYQQPGYPQPGYPQPGAYQPGGYPNPTGYPVGPQGPPVKKKRTGLKITLGVLAGLLVLCCGGSFAFARPILNEYPATLTTPNTVAGMAKFDDPTLNQVTEQAGDSLSKQIGASSTIAAFYAPGGDRSKLVAVIGAASFILNPGSQLKEAFTSFGGSSGIAVTSVTAVDAGTMGGSAKCGSASSSGVTIGLCAWADHGSVGLVMGFGRSPAQTADLLRTIRPEVLHRD